MAATIFNYDDGYRERMVQGLRKAGVPEGAGSELPLAEYKRLIPSTEASTRSAV